MKKKYFKTKKDAKTEYERRNDPFLGIFKMPKGSRHSGEFAVCTYIEYLNTY